MSVKIIAFFLTILIGGFILSLPDIQAAAACHLSSLWSWDYCRIGCKCDAGQGDCDGDFHCSTGYCALDVGAKYGQSKWLDVCEEKKVPAAQPIIPIETKEKETLLPSCQDTDWLGIEKGNLRKRLAQKGSCQDSRGLFPDLCLDDNILRDYFCSASQEGGGSCFYANYYCKAYGFLGCKDGACFEEGNLSIALAEDNPEDQAVIFVGTQGAILLKAKFTASDDEDIIINSLKVYLSVPQAVSNLKLYDEEMQIGQSQTSFADNYAAFNSLNWIIPRASSKMITVKADIPTGTVTPLNLYLQISSGNLEAVGLTTGFLLSSAGSAMGSNITITVQTPEVLCADSDEGINEYVYGWTKKEGVTHYDSCFLGDNLKEWVCTVAGNETYKLMECLLGCADGVCKKSGGNDNSSGVVCRDSDAGKDYETFGKATHGAGDLIAEDICESEKTLRESYCQNGYFNSESYECPLGCSNGACLSQSGFKNIENNLASISKAISQLIEKIREILGQ